MEEEYTAEDIDALLGEEAKKITEEPKPTIKDLFAIKGVSSYLVKSINRLNKHARENSTIQKISELGSSPEGVAFISELIYGEDKEKITKLLKDDFFLIKIYNDVVIKRSIMGKF